MVRWEYIHGGSDKRSPAKTHTRRYFATVATSPKTLTAFGSTGIAILDIISPVWPWTETERLSTSISIITMSSGALQNTRKREWFGDYSAWRRYLINGG